MRRSMAVQILRHAFTMIFGNMGQALRVSIGPYALLILVVVVGLMMIGTPEDGLFDQSGAPDISATGVLVLTGIAVFALFVFGWVAVSWHRFILLEEYAGVLPAVADRPIWPYIGRSILYGFLMIAIAIPIFFIVGLVAAPFMSLGGSLIVFVVASTVLTYIWFRIALALPSVAVGKPISLGEAWAASSGLSGTIFGVAFLLMLINGLSDIVIDSIAPTLPIIGFAMSVAMQWLLLMLGISILTTFYGHLIEKRPLID